MFSRYVIFVEGDTEMGAIPVFAERLNIDLDFSGVGIIKLDGADGVKRCMALYEKFGIPSIAIIDRDRKDAYSEISNVYFTSEMDYEEDVYAKFSLVDYLNYCKKMDMLFPFIKVLKNKRYSFDVQEFIENPGSVTITPEDQALIIR